jgi:NAD+ diphosphatase
VTGPGSLARLALARGGVDRATHRRGDEKWLAAARADPATRVLVVDDGNALVRTTGTSAELVFVPPGEAPDGIRMLLGVAPGDVVYFGVAGPLPDAPAADPAVRPASLREAGPLLSDRDAGLMTHAVALANWHAVFVHCPRCGTVTEPVDAGYARHCPLDGSEHFPKVDPAMIVLVTDPDDRCLLARNAQWPQRRVSILAGFVEAGESAEQAVVREVQEETGLSVGEIRYLGSQPWPMPQSLMLGFRARAIGGQQITVDTDEIAEAQWFSRDELRAAIASERVRLPPPVSIAHRIIESWYGDDLPGAMVTGGRP